MWPNQQCQSTEAGWLVIRSSLDPIRPTPPCYNNTTCMQWNTREHKNTYASPSVVSHTFSVLCMYSKLGHHPHPLGYLCAKFCFFHALHCWASPCRKISYSITHSTNQLLTHPAYLMPTEPKLLLRNNYHHHHHHLLLIISFHSRLVAAHVLQCWCEWHNPSSIDPNIIITINFLNQGASRLWNQFT